MCERGCEGGKAEGLTKTKTKVSLVNSRSGGMQEYQQNSNRLHSVYLEVLNRRGRHHANCGMQYASTYATIRCMYTQTK